MIKDYQKKGETMFIAPDILAEAKEVVKKADMLPICVSTGMDIYVAYVTDESIQAVAGFIGDNGTEYKIGYKNKTTSSDEV